MVQYLFYKKSGWPQPAPTLKRVNSANALDEGLRIGGRGRRMNSKVKDQTN
jgi:hypothetical protein